MLHLTALADRNGVVDLLNIDQLDEIPDDIDWDKVQSLLDAAGYLTRFSAKRARYGFLRGWHRMQSPHAREIANYPLPPDQFCHLTPIKQDWRPWCRDIGRDETHAIQTAVQSFVADRAIGRRLLDAAADNVEPHADPGPILELIEAGIPVQIILESVRIWVASLDTKLGSWGEEWLITAIKHDYTRYSTTTLQQKAFTDPPSAEPVAAPERGEGRHPSDFSPRAQSMVEDDRPSTIVPPEPRMAAAISPPQRGVAESVDAAQHQPPVEVMAHNLTTSPLPSGANDPSAKGPESREGTSVAPLPPPPSTGAPHPLSPAHLHPRPCEECESTVPDFIAKCQACSGTGHYCPHGVRNWKHCKPCTAWNATTGAPGMPFQPPGSANDNPHTRLGAAYQDILNAGIIRANLPHPDDDPTPPQNTGDGRGPLEPVETVGAMSPAGIPWEDILDGYAAGNLAWEGAWGPKPGVPGCKVPVDLLRAAGLASAGAVPSVPLSPMSRR